MAQFNLGNLCGTSANFNKLEQQFEKLKDQLINDVEAEASAAVSNMTGGLVQLDLDLRGILSEKPTLPDVNLQSEIKDLISMTVGSSQYNTKLATLTKQFGDALKGDGKDLALLVVDAALAIALGEDICDLIPNMAVPAAGGGVTTLAKNVDQPEAQSIKDAKSTITTPVAALDKANTHQLARLSKSAELFKQEIEKVDAYAGYGVRVSAETRSKFNEADERIRIALSKEGYTLPVDMHSQDVSDMQEHLIGGTGTSEQTVKPSKTGTAIKEQSFGEAVNKTIAPLSASLSKLSEALNRSSSTFPSNLSSDGTTALFDDGSAEIEDMKQLVSRSRRYQSNIVSAVMSNSADLEFDTSSTVFKSFESDTKTLIDTLNEKLTTLETDYSRPITDNDKIVEDDIEIAAVSLPKISDVI